MLLPSCHLCLADMAIHVLSCLITDRNSHQQIFLFFLEKRGIRHTRTSLYHPAANGAVERFHRVLKSCIQSAVLEMKPWKSTVMEFLQVYRATPHSATGLSPFELLNGRKTRTRLYVLPPPTTRQDAPALLQRVSLKQKKMKAYTDSRRVARTPDFKVGDWVRVRIPTHVPKAHPKFTNPRQIVRKLGACTVYCYPTGRTGMLLTWLVLLHPFRRLLTRVL